MIEGRKTIILIDENVNTLMSISNMLGAEEFNIETYQDSSAALSELIGQHASLAILNIKMKQLDGIEFLRRLRLSSNLPVIFLSSERDKIEEILSLKMGADDFIRKPFCHQVLVERVRAVIRRTTGTGAEVDANFTEKQIVQGLLHIDPARHVCTWDGVQVKLTLSEFSILYALAERPGIVMSRKKLVGAIHDGHMCINYRTVDSHIRRLRVKFREVDKEFDMIDTLYGLGYRYRENFETTV